MNPSRPPRRSRGRAWALLAAAALLAPGCADPAPGSKPTELPDGTSVVVLTIDTLRHDHLSRNGHPRATTPYLDRLAAEGAYFSRCYAQSSWTLPSMLSLFSSLSPATIGVTEGVAPIPKPGQKRAGDLSEEEVLLEYFPEHHAMLPEILAESGFATAGFSTNGHLRIEQGFAQGFELFDQTTCMWDTAACVLERARDWLDGYVAEKRARPFFLWVHLFDPHFDQRFDGEGPQPLYRPAPGYRELFAAEVPGSPPDSLEERTRLAYDRKIRYTDDRIRDFVEELRARKMLGGVVLVVAVDHGEEFNEHGLWGHSKSVRDTLVRVPLIFRFPEPALRGVVDAFVSNLDVAPTLLDYLGIDPPPAMGGVSLLPALRGEPFEPAPAYGETRRFQLDLRFWIDPAAERKLVLDLAKGARQLFSLRDDPDERTDLAALEPERADAMERALRAAVAEMESRGSAAPRRGTLTRQQIEHLRDLGYLQ